MDVLVPEERYGLDCKDGPLLDLASCWSELSQDWPKDEFHLGTSLNCESVKEFKVAEEEEPELEAEIVREYLHEDEQDSR